MDKKRIIAAAGFSAIAAFPLGGFVVGFLGCIDCDNNIFGRVVTGFIFAVLTPLYLGFPPRDEGGSHPPINAWPYILPAGMLVFGFLSYLEILKSRKK
jgi:hypothetical protein